MSQSIDASILTHFGSLDDPRDSRGASANRLVLGQCKGDDKPNEITAIPALLRVKAWARLFLKDA